MLTTKDHIVCGVLAALLSICAKFWLFGNYLEGFTAFMFGWYFYTIFDRYCWARAEQELRNNRWRK